MNTNDETTSTWIITSDLPKMAPLAEDVKTDICVIGAGIAGLSTAYQLAREGQRVIVLDDGPVGGGETCLTTAHLVNALDDRYFELERFHGEKGARLAADSHTRAITEIEETVRREQIDCDFERLDGYLFVPPGESLDVLERELHAAHRAGLVEIQRLTRLPISFFDFGPCLRFPNQGQFHPLKYLNALARAVLRMGGRICGQTHVEKFQGGNPAYVATNTGLVVEAQAIVVATNTPVNDRVAIHTKQAAYRTYVIAGKVPRGSVPKALYWDTQDPYHYVRLQPLSSGDDFLIVGGEDHKTGQQPEGSAPYGKLETWTRARFPMFGGVEHRWSGQIMEPVDSLAFIGRNPRDKDNVFIVTGDSGNGMTHGTIAGMLLRDLILGRENEWKDLYTPSRISPSAASEFARENLNMAAQYSDWLTGSEVNDVAEIKAGTGAILRRGLKKVAVYRDENNQLHELTAVCPHLGGIVNWNAVEKTWDCPCHGSRFDCFGTVVNGPALSNLTPVHEEDEIVTHT